MAHSSSIQGLSFLPPDNRGWQVIELEALPERVLVQIEIPVAKNIFKKLELVSQESPLRVYVNPDPDQPDEWEVPAGSGIKLSVGLSRTRPDG